MSKLFTTEGKVFEIQDGWLASKDEIWKNDHDRSCYVKRHPCTKGLAKGSSRWQGEFEWIDGEIWLISSAISGYVSASFDGPNFRVYVLARTKTEALEKLESKIRERLEQ
jgi:hypothetical protein